MPGGNTGLGCENANGTHPLENCAGIENVCEYSVVPGIPCGSSASIFTVMLPLIQLFLFGFAINANPRHLPTGLIAAEHSTYERTLVAALQNTGYFDIRPLAGEAEGEQALARGDVLFVLNIPPDFSRRIDRGERPQVLMDADATDPTAISIRLPHQPQGTRGGRKPPSTQPPRA